MILAEPLPIIAGQYPRVVIPLVEQALSSISIIVYDWRFYPTQPSHPVSKFNLALADAVRRGVKVRALVNNRGVLNALVTMGCQAHSLETKRMLHTKLMIFDNQKIVIGSHNLTQNAFTTNEEASCLFVIPKDDNQFVKYFNNLWQV